MVSGGTTGPGAPPGPRAALPAPAQKSAGEGRSRSRTSWERATDLLGLAVWVGGLALLALIALAALAYAVGDSLAALVLPQSSLVTVAAMLAATAVILLILRRFRHRMVARGLRIGIALTALTRLLAILLIHPPLQSDFLLYHQLATSVAASGPFLTDRPMGYPIVLGALYRLFGQNAVIGELLNAGLAVLVAALVYELARGLFGRRTAFWAIVFYALSPAQALMTTVLASEGPYATLVLAALWVTQWSKGRPLVRAAVTGIILGLAQYVRSTGLVLLPAFAVVPLLERGPLRQFALCLVVTCATFGVTLAPVVGWNESTSRGLSVATSSFGGWTLLVGTDPARDGSYNPALAELVGGTPGTPQFDRRAGEIAIARIEAHPLGFARLALRKFPRMWGPDDYGVFYAIDPAPPADPGISSGLALLSQLAYVAVLLLAVVGLVAERARRHPVVLAMLLVVAAVAALHTFAEIQPRYHSYLVPIFCVLAGHGARVSGAWLGLRRKAAGRGRPSVDNGRQHERQSAPPALALSGLARRGPITVDSLVGASRPRTI